MRGKVPWDILSYMAICRFGDDSDLHVYERSAKTGTPGRGYRDEFVCCQCALLSPPADAVLGAEREALAHLVEHVRAGHKVPSRATERLERSAREKGARRKLSSHR